MVQALVVLAEGFEEIEATTIVDVLRRARIEVTTASLGATLVQGSHGISIMADAKLDSLRAQSFDAVVLPGGLPGSTSLRDDQRVHELVKVHVEQGRLVGAICAAPIALEAAGVLKGRRATSYPGHELPSARYVDDRVVEDGNVVTSRGPGTAFAFALHLVERLVGADVADRLRSGMLVS